VTKQSTPLRHPENGSNIGKSNFVYGVVDQIRIHNGARLAGEKLPLYWLL